MFGLASQRAHNRVITERDYRGPTFGPFDAAIEGMRRLQPRLRTPLYGVLGNHDTIRMVPDLEDMGVRVLLNECEPISRGKDRIFLAGIDDAHYFRVDNIEKAAASIPHEGFSILLSHTPEIYRQAAHAGFDLGADIRTAGKSACRAVFQSRSIRFYLVIWDQALGLITTRPVTRAGSSVVAVRTNYLPEITLHHLRCGSGPVNTGGPERAV
jgi:hypothetical protein